MFCTYSACSSNHPREINNPSFVLGDENTRYVIYVSDWTRADILVPDAAREGAPAKGV